MTSLVGRGLFVLSLGGALSVAGGCSVESSAPRPCVPPPRTAETGVALEPALGDARFRSPVEMIEGPGRRFYVVEQEGVLRAIPRDGAAAAFTVIDLTSRVVTGGEAGLLGIAFDPAFAENGFVYLHFDERLEQKPEVVFQSVISRFQSRDGGATLDPSTERRVLVVDQPFSNHNGGKIAFGPDGLLYIALGDGGSGNDPRGNGQNRDTLLGKILRIDPRSGEPYAIPPSNPFAGGGGRPEIFAYGLRNPWKFSFDTATGEIWCGDVGQSRFEEIDKIVLGGNYGWSVREGKDCRGGGDGCASDGFIDPIVEYPRTDGVSVTGGYVYRGSRIGGLHGHFVYGDFGSGQIWMVDEDVERRPVAKLLLASELKISTFAQDGDGEVYVVDYLSGAVKQLVAGPAGSAPAAGASTLSETGCVDVAEPSRAPEGAIAYSVNSPLWSDRADKERWLFVPEARKIHVAVDGDFDVPNGSVAVKTFSLGGKRIETRLFVRYDDGGWAGYSYEWNDAQTDAVLLADGKTKELGGGASWTFPSRAECFTCHTAASGFTLGLEARQLRRDDGGDVLERFAPHLDTPIARDVFSPLRALDDASASIEERARSYLHANCSMCHRDGSGAGAATLDLRIDRSLLQTNTCNVEPHAGDLGIADARIVRPGDPSRSTLTLRMRATDGTRMPTVASRVVDEQGTAAVESWIRGLTGCP